MYRPVPSIGSKSCLWVVGWMYQVDVYLRIRRAVMVDGMSIREVSRVFGLHRDTVRKILAYSVPPGYRRQTPPRRPNPSTSSGGALHRRHRPNPGRRPQASQEAAPHSPADLPATQGRAWVRRPVHHSQGLREGAPPPVVGVFIDYTFQVKAKLPQLKKAGKKGKKS